MKFSAGICIIHNNKILFCHPTNAAWAGTFGPPKGGLNENETNLEAAIRETKEEIGIDITTSMISNCKKPIEIIYYHKKTTVIYKIIYLYLVKINNLSEIGLISEIIPANQLQISEIDYAKFYNKEEASKLIFHRFSPLLDLI